MDEEKIQRSRREQDEKSTRERAAILGIQYFDARDVEETIALTRDILDNDTMHKNRIIPLVGGDESIPWRFGVTTQTPQSLIHDITKQYNDDGKAVQFFLISTSAYKTLMNRYDPPIKVVYDDIEIAKEGDSDTIAQVSQTLNSVGSDEVFDYLIDQADKLGASDIHIENERTHIRIRMRIDGTLHPVADLDSDRYRIILGALASRANISTAATEPQSGHMQKEITRGDATHLLNLRVETVPTMYGQDAVLRLFNFDESMLNLD
jgi:type II secretory ATPase GspE/PulE/Tfp pilus assembly ATPase PilB-like protein